MNFKIGDKVLYHTLDKRHIVDDVYNEASLPLGLIYTVSQFYRSGKLTRVEVKECANFNYDGRCFKLYKARKLKIKLP